MPAPLIDLLDDIEWAEEHAAWAADVEAGRLRAIAWWAEWEARRTDAVRPVLDADALPDADDADVERP
jgi:hypothetical protein